MLFCQFGHLNSLRVVCLGLACCQAPLKQLGILAAPNKSTLSYANAHRPWELYQSVFFQVQQKAQADALVRGGHRLRFKNKLVSLDGSVIELSASMFDWAKYRVFSASLRCPGYRVNSWRLCRDDERVRAFG